MKWILFPHSGCLNHGCEALARTMIPIINDFDSNSKVILYSMSADSDIKYGLDTIAKIKQIPTKNISPSQPLGIYLRTLSKIMGNDVDFTFIGNKHHLYKSCDIALSIGGDNYCYPGMQHVLNEHTKAISYWRKPKILWGCSIDKDQLSPTTITDLACYDAIIARESITLSMLNDLGLGSKSSLATDTAFLLPTQETPWPDQRLNSHKVYGINISPLINRYADRKIILNNYITLIKEILKNNEAMVALIPHVEQNKNNDLEASITLAHAINDDRVVTIPNGYNSMQIKSMISKCACFIGARTHATIAAYSTCIPTLVVGYSTKSRGIAKDIFGSEKGLVVPVQNMQSENTLVLSYLQFVERMEDIKNRLRECMGNYSNKAYKVIEVFKNVI